MVKCEICGKELRQIHYPHLRIHNLTFEQYKQLYPNSVTCSDETRQKLSQIMSGENNHMFGIRMIGSDNPFYGKKHSKETKQKIRESKKGKHLSVDARKKRLENPKNNPFYGKKHTDKFKNNMRSDNNPMKRPEVRQKITGDKNPMKSPEVLKTYFKKLAIKPNNFELRVMELLNQILPNEYQYNGDYSAEFSIEGKIPDFVCLEKRKIVEANGTYWHANDDGTDRIGLFKSYGFDTFIIWEDQPFDDSFIRSILSFHNGEN